MKSTNTDKISFEVAKILLDIGTVIFRPQQPFRFDSGIISPIYVDNRLLISYPKERRRIISFLVQKIKRDINVSQVIAGVATAGIAHAAWVAEELNLPMIYVRPATKDHGRGRQVEGYLKKGQKVLIVEDMVSTAGSSRRVVDAIRKIGATVTDEIAIYTHLLEEANLNFKKLKVRFQSLTDLKAVTGQALKSDLLTSKQVELILNWSKDPQGWAKKMKFL